MFGKSGLYGTCQYTRHWWWSPWHRLSATKIVLFQKSRVALSERFLCISIWSCIHVSGWQNRDKTAWHGSVRTRLAARRGKSYFDFEMGLTISSLFKNAEYCIQLLPSHLRLDLTLSHVPRKSQDTTQHYNQ